MLRPGPHLYFDWLTSNVHHNMHSPVAVAWAGSSVQHFGRRHDPNQFSHDSVLIDDLLYHHAASCDVLNLTQPNRLAL